MKTKREQKFGILCMITLISVLLYSCSINNQNTYIEISTSGCYKTCPIIDLKLENDEVLFGFIKFNKREGVYEYELSPKDKESVKLLLERIDLSKLQEEYVSNRVDMQVYNILIKNNTGTKHIYFYENDAPEGLDSLVKKLISFRDEKMIKSDKRLDVETRDVFPPLNIPDVPPPPVENKN